MELDTQSKDTEYLVSTKPTKTSKTINEMRSEKMSDSLRGVGRTVGGGGRGGGLKCTPPIRTGHQLCRERSRFEFLLRLVSQPNLKFQNII